MFKFLRTDNQEWDLLKDVLFTLGLYMWPLIYKIRFPLVLYLNFLLSLCGGIWRWWPEFIISLLCILKMKIKLSVYILNSSIIIRVIIIICSIYLKWFYKLRKSNFDFFFNGIEFGYIQKMSMRVLCGGWASCCSANRFLALTSQFPFCFPFQLPFIFKDYHPTVTTCFLSCDMRTHYFSLSTAYYSLALILISNYTWMITIYLKVKPHYEA